MPHRSIAVALALGLAMTTSSPAAAQDGDFRACLTQIRPAALAQGVPAALFDRVVGQMTPDPSLTRLLESQPEFSRQPWDYINGQVTAARVAEGRRMLERHRAAFERAERDTGVSRFVIAAIWGVETSFGKVRGSKSVLRSTATLSCMGRRQEFFRGEFVAALKVLARGHVAQSNFIGSWAGAFGHTQFMPSTFLRAARSSDGSPRIDIIGSPADAIMSTGNLLRVEGWQRGQAWFYEVELPATFDFALAHRDRPRTLAEWQRMGAKRVGGREFPAANAQAAAFVLLPGGARGPAFIMMPNFRVIMKYNNSENYAIAVGHLADRLAGGGTFSRPWPTTERALSRDERFELQNLLARAGLYSGTIDGKLGAGTREALQRFQARARMPADGFPTPAVLARLRQGA